MASYALSFNSLAIRAKLGLDGLSRQRYSHAFANEKFCPLNSLDLVERQVLQDSDDVFTCWNLGLADMYAIIVDGGRQYKVSQGQRLDIDLRKDLSAGDTVEFGQVLAIGGDEGLKLGTPSLDGAKVTAKVISEEKGDKIYIQKFRRRKNYHRRNGHRQKYTRIEIAEIAG